MRELLDLLQGEMSSVPTEQEARWDQSSSECVINDTKL